MTNAGPLQPTTPLPPAAPTVCQREKMEKRQTDQSVAPTSFLWLAYVPDRYYFEVSGQSLVKLQLSPGYFEGNIAIPQQSLPVDAFSDRLFCFRREQQKSVLPSGRWVRVKMYGI